MNIFVCNDKEAKMAWLHNHDYFCRARVYLGTWSVHTLGQVVLLPTGAAEWNVLEGF
jgi:hypothetical protein